MIKYKKVFLILVFVIMLVLCSCRNSSNSTSSNSSEASKQQKYEISLNMDNYKTYVDIKSEYNGNSTRVYFDGTLSYAYYDNVVITYERNYSGVTTSTVELSAGGYAHWYTTGYGTYSITGVSGKVIYWI